MKEKKELKRYYLVEYVGTRSTIVKNKEELKELLKTVKKYNNKQSNKYLYGNISIIEVENGYEVTSHIYNKLTKRSTISEIDMLTSRLDEKGLIELFNDNRTTLPEYIPDINIAYFDNKNIIEENENLEYKIKYLPIMYNEDTCYIDREYIKNCLKFHAENKNYAFFTGLANRFYLTKQIEEIREKMYKVVNEVEFQNRDENDLYRVALELYDDFIRERDKNGRLIRNENGQYLISKRRQRDFGFYVRDYKMLKSKIPSPLKYNKSLISEKIKELERFKKEFEAVRQKTYTLKF